MRLRHLLVSAFGGALVCAGSAHAAGAPIMPLSEVHAGMECTGETVVQGTTITSFNVHVIDVVQDPEGPRILISVSGPAVDRTGIAEGFSGSPVFCPDGGGRARNIGGISEGIGEYGNKVALVTPIEQMLGEPISPPSSGPRLAIRGRPLLTPLTVGGLSPALEALVARAGRRTGRTILASPSSPGLAFPPQELLPGASVSTAYATGAITVGAVGTVTYRNGNVVYAFGHPLDDVGRRSLILGDAYVYYVVGNPNVDQTTSYKLAAPGHAVGVVSSDTPNAVIGQTGQSAPTTPIDVIAHDLDVGQRMTLHTDVADETDIGNPTGGSLIDTVGPLAIAQAATDIYNGAPANESGNMCLSVTLRESRAPLRFCNRYVGSAPPGSSGALPPVVALLGSTDATTALGLIDAQSFARLHVMRVRVTLDVQRGLNEGTIVSAAAPTRVKAGDAVRLRLRVRRFRAGVETVAFPVHIPLRARGRITLRIAGPGTPNGADALANALVSSMFGEGSPSAGAGQTSPPRSLPALRRAFSAVGHYDGLVIRFGAGSPQHAYRDPRLLIGGSVKLAFVVSR